MTTLIWSLFIVFILTMLALDLGVLSRRNESLSGKKALAWTGFCILLALAFSVVVYFLYHNQLISSGTNLSGSEAVLQFLTAWIVEQSLSLDNIFVIALIFSYFKIEKRYQHRVLFWGIIGALVMRGIMIAIGAALIASFIWVHYLFGALLIYAAIKILTVKEGSIEPERNILFRVATALYPVSNKLHGEKFFVRIDGKRAITPLFLVLLVIESTDVLFAVDSIPACFAITQDPFLVFTSNIFAILNLRSLYFALAAILDRFKHVKTALIFILIFVGLKMIAHNHLHIPTIITFIVIVGSLSISVVTSLMSSQKHKADK